MAQEQTELINLAAELRQAFDQTFAAAPILTSEQSARFLAIGIGGDSYALRLLEISGLFADQEVVPLPSRSAHLLGIASFRGVVVPVYDLRSLLGYPAGAHPRWLALVAPGALVALAFEHLDGYLDLPPEAIAPTVGPTQTRQHIVATIRDTGIVRSVIDTASIVAMIKQQR